MIDVFSDGVSIPLNTMFVAETWFVAMRFPVYTLPLFVVTFAAVTSPVAIKFMVVSVNDMLVLEKIN
jgi:hypothetical protein